MMTKKPKYKAVVVQIAEFEGNKYVRKTNHRLSVFDSNHNEVFKIIQAALAKASGEKVPEKSGDLKLMELKRGPKKEKKSEH